MTSLKKSAGMRRMKVPLTSVNNSYASQLEGKHIPPPHRLALSVIVNIFTTDGTTVRARMLLEILGKIGDVLVITRRGARAIDNGSSASSALRSEVIRVIKPENTRLWNFKLAPVVLENRRTLDMVYCVADLFGFLTYHFFSKIFKYKTVFEAHSVCKEKRQFSKFRSLIFFLLEVFVGRKADAIIALSGSAYQFYGALNKNVFFVPVFIDTDFFKSATKTRKEERKVIGLIGPFDTLANEHQLTFLYSKLQDFDNRVRFKIIGRCGKKLIDERLAYTGYLKSLEDYKRALCELDALLVPVRIATYGPKNKILEAMSCNVPVFGTPQAFLGLDFAEPNHNVFVYEEAELVSKINEILFLDNLLLKVGKAARNTVERFYDKKMNAEKLIEVLRGILVRRH
jgi:glycosyltransferase involved in cell wall biosynthesis